MSSRAEKKERSKQNILESAANLLRRKGVSGARVADVMEGAGLTVGGFYAHFASKEALLEETLRRTAAAMREQLFSGLDRKPPEARAEVVLKRYLSAAHRDDPSHGCPLPAVTSEVALSEEAYRDVLAEQVRAMAEELTRNLPSDEGSARARKLSLGLVALMVGGLVFARAFRGTPLSDEMLEACREVGRRALRGRPERT